MNEKDVQALINMGKGANPFPEYTKIEQAERLIKALIPLMREIAEDVKCAEWENCDQCPIKKLIDESGMNLHPDAYDTLEYCEVF